MANYLIIYVTWGSSEEKIRTHFFFFFFVIFLNDFEYSIDQKYSGLNLPLVGDINVCVSDDNVEHFLKIYILLYAENTIAFAESADELQLALNVVHDYCNN